MQGEDILQSDPDAKRVQPGLAAMESFSCRTFFLDETANFQHISCGSTFLEKDGTFTEMPSAALTACAR